MEQVIDLVLAAVPNTGDKVEYGEFYNSLPGELRGYLRKALQVLKADGRVKSEIVYADGVNTHSLVRQ